MVMRATKIELFRNIALLIITVVVILGGVELFFRITKLKLKDRTRQMIFSNEYVPYLGFINSPNRSGEYSVPNQLTGKLMVGKRSTNNWGYRANINYGFVKYYEKKQNEKIVLLTGGSAAAGAGASEDSQTIDARMQYYLNTYQDRYSYTVFNFANGGWVAMQELIGVQLFGKQLDPDWIVTMNGRNDIAVCIDHNEGVAAHMHNALIDSYIYGYLECGGATTFYRGEFENYLIEHSYAYRGLTGKVYIPRKQYIIKKHGMNMVGTKVTWDDVEKQIEFYVRIQGSFIGINDHCKYILSLQPLVHGYTNAFEKTAPEELKKQALGGSNRVVDAVSLAKYVYRNGKKIFGLLGNDTGPAYGPSALYFYRAAQVKLMELVGSYHDKADVEYVYGGIVFDDRTDTGTYFLDEVHMTDQGEDRVAKLYALMILRRDFPERKNEFNALLKDLIMVKQYPFEYS